MIARFPFIVIELHDEQHSPTRPSKNDTREVRRPRKGKS